MRTPPTPSPALLVAFLAAAAAICGPAERRIALIEAAKGAAAVPSLASGLNDENAVVRRTAARLLAEQGEPGKLALVPACQDTDMLVRLTALKALAQGAKGEAMLIAAVGDQSPMVRLFAVEQLAAQHPRSKAAEAALAKAASDEDEQVRNLAVRAQWPFHRDVVSIRDRKDWDHEVEVIQAIPLPKENWRFRLDPKREGHRKKWFAPEFDDSKWKAIAIEQAWQKAGYDYIGVSWYRRQVELPAKPEGTVNAVEICFDGVDECAWVWINGVYVGGHDIGPGGWDKPFHLDVTKEIRWGATNQVTVRAMNTAHAGGIWKPVRFEVLR
jgi:hypothetical protein